VPDRRHADRDQARIIIGKKLEGGMEGMPFWPPR
jgi:hypothetical protein